MDGEFGGGAPPGKSDGWWRKERLRRARNKVGVKFKVAEIKAHMPVHHPNCPEWIRHELYRRIRERRWAERLGRAVGITMEKYVRHELTQYELLFGLKGMTKEEARRLVRPEVSGIIASWGPNRPDHAEQVIVVLRGRPQGDDGAVDE